MKLVIRDAAIGYNPAQPLQRDVNLTLSSGEVCCVLGPNGCGKSTLIQTVLGMQPLLAGTITLDGRDLTRASAAELAASVAYVAQSHAQPFPYLVKEVVMLGRSGKVRGLGGQPTRRDRNIVENAMEMMGIRDLRDVPYVDISGGELQLVMFARALAQEPKLLILDEPTSALDFGNAVRVIRRVRDMAGAGLGVLMVTHDPDHAFMTKANVALFSHDCPMRFGAADEIITRRNVQEAYGIGVKLVEFVHASGEVMRTCAPEFGDEDVSAGADARVGAAAAAPGDVEAKGRG